MHWQGEIISPSSSRHIRQKGVAGFSAGSNTLSSGVFMVEAPLATRREKKRNIIFRRHFFGACHSAREKGRMASFEINRPFDLRKMSFSKKKIFFPDSEQNQYRYFSKEAILPFSRAEMHTSRKICEKSSVIFSDQPRVPRIGIFLRPMRENDLD